MANKKNDKKEQERLIRMKKLIRANNIYEKKDIRLFDKFNKFGYYDLYNNLGGSPKEFIFFTRPDLHLFDGNSLNPQIKDSFFKDALARNGEVMHALQKSASGGAKTPFLNLLTNKVISNADLPSVSSSEMTTAENIYGDSITYRLGSGSSFNAFDFSLEFEDTRYLDVYMLFKIWDNYADKKAKGNVTPPDPSYTINKILHDQVAMFKFIVEDDMETIIHYSKYIGVYPKEVPLTTFSNLEDNVIKHTVEFHAQFVEDMEPAIIDDFNKLTSSYKNGTKNSPVYDKDLHHVNNEWVKIPYIESFKYKNSNRKQYKLKWGV